MTPTTAATAAGLPKATLPETLGVLAGVVAPTVAKGVIIRRPRMVAPAERFDLDRRAVRRVQRLRDRYGPGPLLLPNPVRPQALILAPEHVHRVLDGSPRPFAAASSEKRAALAPFQPQGVLISRGPERAARRRFNETVLDTPRPIHRLAERFAGVVDEESAAMLATARRRRVLAWDTFAAHWFRVVRRIVLGDGTGDDQELTDLINRLRSDANWAFFRPQRPGLRDRFYQRLEEHLSRAEPDSLAGTMAATPATDATAPAQQVPQWLFAFDPAGMTTFRTLALLATHPEPAERARAELRASTAAVPELPFLRACVLESLRLWPTTPMVLRQSSEETVWQTGTLPADTGIMIFAPFFHRDDARLPEADRFAPELWRHERSDAEWTLIPFSRGPVVCPGQNLVLLTTTSMLARLLTGPALRLERARRLDPRRPLPGTLNNDGLRFAVDG